MSSSCSLILPWEGLGQVYFRLDGDGNHSPILGCASVPFPWRMLWLDSGLKNWKFLKEMCQASSFSGRRWVASRGSQMGRAWSVSRRVFFILKETTLPLCRGMTDSPQQDPLDCQLRHMVRGTAQALFTPQMAFPPCSGHL